MDLQAYHMVWMNGATEAEAIRAGEESYDNHILKARERKGYEAMEREGYEAMEREIYEYEQELIAEHEAGEGEI